MGVILNAAQRSEESINKGHIDTVKILWILLFVQNDEPGYERLLLRVQVLQRVQHYSSRQYLG